MNQEEGMSLRFIPAHKVILLLLTDILPVSHSSINIIEKGNQVADLIKTIETGDAWVAQMVKRLPSVQVMIPGSWVPAPRRAPCSVGSLLVPLPLLLPLLVRSL